MSNDKNCVKKIQGVSVMALKSSPVGDGSAPHLEVDPVNGLGDSFRLDVNIEKLVAASLPNYKPRDLALDKSYFDKYSVFLSSIDVSPDFPSEDYGPLASVLKRQPIASFTLVDNVTGEIKSLPFLAPEGGYVFFKADLGDNNRSHTELIGFKSNAGVESIVYTDGMHSDNGDVCLMYIAGAGDPLAVSDNFAVIGATSESANLLAMQYIVVGDAGSVSRPLKLKMSPNTSVFGRIFIAPESAA